MKILIGRDANGDHASKPRTDASPNHFEVTLNHQERARGHHPVNRTPARAMASDNANARDWETAHTVHDQT